jgi:hypothetical protein
MRPHDCKRREAHRRLWWKEAQSRWAAARKRKLDESLERLVKLHLQYQDGVIIPGTFGEEARKVLEELMR